MAAKKFDLNAEGKKLYDACISVKPAWEILGETTKSVWKERVKPPKTSNKQVRPKK